MEYEGWDLSSGQTVLPITVMAPQVNSQWPKLASCTVDVPLNPPAIGIMLQLLVTTQNKLTLYMYTERQTYLRGRTLEHCSYSEHYRYICCPPTGFFTFLWQYCDELWSVAPLSSLTIHTCPPSEAVGFLLSLSSLRMTGLHTIIVIIRWGGDYSRLLWSRLQCI